MPVRDKQIIIIRVFFKNSFISNCREAGGFHNASQVFRSSFLFIQG